MSIETNKAIPRRVTEEAWNRGNLAVLDELVAPGFVRHTPLRPEGIRGIEGFKQHVVATRAAFPDAEFTIDDEVAEGDKVVNRWTFRGTHQGEFAGIPPTDRAVTMTGMGIVRIAEGKITEIWDEADALGLLQQLGVLTPSRPEEERTVRGHLSRPAQERDPSGGGAVSNEGDKALIRRHEVALNSGRIDAGLDLFADPCLFNGQPVGREDIRRMRTILWTAAPDVRWIAEHIFAEGDWVAVRWAMRGTHTGEFVHPTWGTAPASGKPVVLTYLDHYRIADGQIAEAWEVRDGLSLQAQFGLDTVVGRTASR